MNKRLTEIDLQIEILMKEKQQILLEESKNLSLLEQIENLEEMGFGITDWLVNIFEDKSYLKTNYEKNMVMMFVQC